MGSIPIPRIHFFFFLLLDVRLYGGNGVLR